MEPRSRLLKATLREIRERLELFGDEDFDDEERSAIRSFLQGLVRSRSAEPAPEPACQHEWKPLYRDIDKCLKCGEERTAKREVRSA